MPRLVTYACLIALALTSLLFIKNPVLVGLVSGIATGFAVPFIDLIWVNIRYVRLWWGSIRYRDEMIRVSFSYLFRIKLGGRYLLVRGRRFKQQFQPVGGVYKLSGSVRDKMLAWRVQGDDFIPLDDVSQNDIRLRVPSRHLLAFVRWFESGKDRETSPWREFYEELVATGILSHADFPYIHHNFVRREIRPLRYSDYAQSRELLIADIYDLLPTPAQVDALRETVNDTSDLVCWVSSNEIMRLGATPGFGQRMQISETARWTL